MSVLLPAPFSPSRASTSPRRSVRSTHRSACTPGNALLMPFMSSSSGASAGTLCMRDVSLDDRAGICSTYCSLPPCGGGWGWGVGVSTPHPNPPPQGGKKECCTVTHCDLALSLPVASVQGGLQYCA